MPTGLQMLDPQGCHGPWPMSEPLCCIVLGVREAHGGVGGCLPSKMRAAVKAGGPLAPGPHDALLQVQGQRLSREQPLTPPRALAGQDFTFLHISHASSLGLSPEQREGRHETLGTEGSDREGRAYCCP